jgi:hypothetical protein
VGSHIIGIKLNGASAFLFCRRPIPFVVVEDLRQRCVRLSQVRVELQRLERGHFGVRVYGVRGREPVVAEKPVIFRYACVS